MDIQVIINIMIQLFIMIFLGYILFKTNVFDKNFNQKLTKFLLHIALPALIINSVLEQSVKPAAETVKITFFVGIAIYLILPVIGLIVAKLIRADIKKQGLYAFMMTFSNVGFMGFPVIDAIYGSTAVFYTAIINIVFNIAAFTVGVLLLRYGGGANSKINLLKLFTPGIIFSILAVFIYVFDIRFPAIVEKTIGSIGNTTTPLAMLLMGSTLATMPLRQIFNEGKVYLFSIIKQIVIPIILFPTVKYFVHDELLFGVVIILLMMPIATNAIMFAIEYNSDEKLAAKAVFLSTLMSLVTIPLIIFLLKI
ncbi:MAG: AEC family transporter [Lachnospiraceae bacterium]|nr:AEC family transporter [Lachnospiraceae bacterium]